MVVIITESDNTAIKIPGCTVVNSCNYDANATVNDGSCTFLPSGTISGNTSSNPLDTEIYSYSPSSGSEYSWSVQNGEIISGEDSNSITVRWHIATQKDQYLLLTVMVTVPLK